MLVDYSAGKKVYLWADRSAGTMAEQKAEHLVAQKIGPWAYYWVVYSVDPRAYLLADWTGIQPAVLWVGQ